MKIEPGLVIQYGGELWRIVKTIGTKTLKIKNEVNKKNIEIPRSAIDFEKQNEDKEDLKLDLSLDFYPKESIDRANRRFQIIASILNGKTQGRKEIEQLANDNDVSVASIYKWMNDYRSYNGLRGLIDSPLKGGTRVPRISKDVETVMALYVKKYFQHKASIESVYIDLEERLRKLNLDIPHINTFKKRLREFDEAQRDYHFNGKKHADAKYSASPGKMPDGNFPLEIVQIDSSRLDIILVDDEGNILGEPWITISIDTKTRSVLGFNISFGHPSFFNLGRTLFASVLTKEKYLERIGLKDQEWDRFGIPSVIFTDNGSDFRSEDFHQVCKAYGITQRYRPKGSPKTGGIIERYIGTVKGFLTELPGYTKVGEENFRKKKPLKEARFTIKELEKLFTLWILTVYHVRPHNAKSMNKFSPNEMWNKGFDGDENNKGIGFPRMITNTEIFNIDLLPSISRTIRHGGVVINHNKYFSPILNHFVNRKEKYSGGKLSNRNQRHDFKINLADISHVHFKNPITKKYERIENTDLKILKSKPSLYEFNQSKKKKENSPEKVKHNYAVTLKGKSNLKKEANTLSARKAKEIKREQLEKTKLDFQEDSSPKIQPEIADEVQINITPFKTKRN